MKTIDLESTVRAAQKGDIDAFTHLVRTHQAMVCATTLAITASIPASEDVAQQAFVAAWNKLRELREPRRFSGWIRQIARNLGLKHQRGTERRAARVVSHPEGEGTGVEHATPESQLIAHEQDALLADALTSLPEETREVLALYYRDETSTREIADQLGLSEPTVRKRLSRARTVLHTAVDERLHRGLRATRPGAAFTAAVLAVIAASPPAHAGTQRPVTALLAACLALCILLWMLWPLSGEDRSLAVSTPPPPSQTARSVRTQRGAGDLQIVIPGVPGPRVLAVDGGHAMLDHASAGKHASLGHGLSLLQAEAR